MDKNVRYTEAAQNLEISKIAPLVLSYLKVLGGNPEEIINAIGRVVENSPRTRVTMGPRSFYFLTEPHDILYTLGKSSKKCPISKAKQATTSYHPGLKIGNISQESELWMQHRRGLGQFVGRNGLKHNFDLASEAATDYIGSWKGKIDINVKDETEILAFKYSWSAFLSETLSDNEAAQVSHEARSLNKYMTTSMALMGRAPISILKSFTGVNNFVKTIDEKLNKVIDTRLQVPEAYRPTDFLSFVIDRNNLDKHPSPANRLQALSELAEIIIASSINSSVTLYSAMHHLSAEPAFQQRIRHNNDNHDVSKCPHDLSKGTTNSVAESVALETLRLYPPAHLLVRKSIADVQFDYNFTIPKNNYIFIPSWFVHRDPRWYPDPENFNPDVNFSPAAKNNRPNMSFLSFAGGRHGCPGRGAALQQVSTILSLIYNSHATTAQENTVPHLRIGAVLDPEPESRLSITDL